MVNKSIAGLKEVEGTLIDCLALLASGHKDDLEKAARLLRLSVLNVQALLSTMERPNEISEV